MRNRLLWLIVAVAVIGFLLFRAGIFGGGNTQKETITFGFTPWTTTYPGTFVAKKLISDRLGYPTKLEKADVGVVYAGMARGDIDVFMDSWLPDLHRDYLNKYGNKLENVSTIYTNAILGWGVPNFIDQGVKSIADLNNYRDLFDGKVTGIDPGAGMSRTSKKVIDEYNLDYQYVASSEAAMLTEVASAFKNKTPLLFLVYRPHSMFAKWDIRVLEDPKGVWSASEVHAMANSGLKTKAPEVYRFLKRFKMPLKDYEAWILKQDEEHADPEDLADEWIKNNPDKVKQFLGES